MSINAGARPSNARPGVTMEHVAREAGVHPATVSRVLSRPEVVKPETLARVVAAIELLGYVPHAGARQLAGGRTGVVAAFVPDLANPFFASLLKAIQAAVHPTGSRVMVADTEFDARTEVELVRTFAGNIDAAVLCVPVASTAALTEAAGSTNLVFVNRRAAHVPSVTVDQAEIVRLAVAHLRQLGHRRIAVATGPRSYWSSAQRARAALGGDDLLLVENVEPTFTGGTQLLDRLLTAGITGVIAFNDQMALGLLRAASDAGLSLPEDLSVVGSDDIEMAAMSWPPLTTVAAPIGELGRQAVALVHRGGNDKNCRVALAPHLVERGSTAAPKK